MKNNTEKEKALELMKSTNNKRLFERYQTIYLTLLGKKADEIAEIIGRTSRTVYNYIKAYRNSGFEGLTMTKPSGRPKRLSDEQEQELKELILTKAPVDVGFPAEFNWTASLIGKWIEKEYQIKYTIRGITGILKRLNLSYTKPTYALTKADPKKQEEFKKEFKSLKKNY